MSALVARAAWAAALDGQRSFAEVAVEQERGESPGRGFGRGCQIVGVLVVATSVGVGLDARYRLVQTNG